MNQRNFLSHETACEENINNSTQDPAILADLNRLADKLQEMRFVIEVPIIITNCFSSIELNRRLGRRDDSQHTLGQAADLIAPKFGSVKKIVFHLKDSGVIVDQCLIEKDHVHVSIRKTGENRNEYAYYLNGVKIPI